MTTFIIITKYTVSKLYVFQVTGRQGVVMAPAKHNLTTSNPRDFDGIIKCQMKARLLQKLLSKDKLTKAVSLAGKEKPIMNTNAAGNIECLTQQLLILNFR